MYLTDEILSYTPEELKMFAAAMIMQISFVILGTAFVALIVYAIRAFALTKIARKLHLDNTSAAWIPFGHAYVEGLICDSLKSVNLDKSNTRIHYMMINLLTSILNTGYLIYRCNSVVINCMEIYSTGEIPLSLMNSETDYTLTAIVLLTNILSIVVAYFRFRSLILCHICFNKKNGMGWIMLSLIISQITPFIYLSLSKLTPVNTSIEKINIMPKE